MAEGSEQAPVVVPVRTVEGSEPDCLAVTPRAAPGDGFRLLQPDDGFGPGRWCSTCTAGASWAGRWHGTFAPNRSSKGTPG